MKDFGIRFGIIFLLVFSMGSFVAIDSMNSLRDNLILITTGGMSMLLLIFFIYKLFVKGYFDELK